jgi:yecA family protein
MPAYQDINKLLNRIANTINAMTPAGVHGMVCGFICAGTEMNGKALFTLMPSKPNLDQQGLQQYRQLLLQLYETSQQKLQSTDLDFYLLLPDDDEDLPKRSQALTDWCQGFMNAMEHSGLQLGEHISAECYEAVQYLERLARLDYQSVEPSQQEEEAYIELVEYIRIVVLMVYTEIITTQQGNQQLGANNLH